jgi:GTP-binding protein HflX
MNHSLQQETEKAILVGVHSQSMSDLFFQSSFEELVRLTETAGAKVVESVVQKRDKPDNATYIGRGKLDDLERLIIEWEADLVIFDGELTPTQIRNLEKQLDIKILDRTQLILDIFSTRARTKEGNLQVELARLQYLLPRLTGKGRELSRQAGGIGARGAGEQKLETDRRHIRRRIDEIKRHIEDVKRHRDLHRKRRQKNGVPIIALVGYTNAGKSSLFNALYRVLAPKSEVIEETVKAEDKLFATLDTTTRQIHLTNGMTSLLTDTVGFIQNLPHHLVAAFRSTLEEAAEANLLLHVIDRSSSQYQEQMETVENILQQLGAEHIPTIQVFNKMDLINISGESSKDDFYVSALTGEGLESLIQSVENRFKSDTIYQRLKIPYEASSTMSLIHRVGDVQYKNEEEDGWMVHVRWKEQDYGRVKENIDPFEISAYTDI